MLSYKHSRPVCAEPEALCCGEALIRLDSDGLKDLCSLEGIQMKKPNKGVADGVNNEADCSCKGMVVLSGSAASWQGHAPTPKGDVCCRVLCEFPSVQDEQKALKMSRLNTFTSH